MNQEKNNLEPQDEKPDDLSGSIDPEALKIKNAKKKSDHRLGVGLFFGVNIPLGLLVTILSSLNPSLNVGDISVLFQVLFPWLVNIGLLIYLVKINRSDIALGYLGGFFYALLIGLVLGVCFTVYCFTQMAP